MKSFDLKEKIKDLKDTDIWELYAFVSTQLRDRGLVRTRNIVGERGEFLAIETYNSTPGLNNLQAAPEGTQNVDALSRKGERYNIKTISIPGRTTGAFFGLSESDSQEVKKFEYLIIVVINESYNLEKIIELTWCQFLEFRKWHKTIKAWNISLTKRLLNEAKIVVSND